LILNKLKLKNDLNYIFNELNVTNMKKVKYYNYHEREHFFKNCKISI